MGKKNKVNEIESTREIDRLYDRIYKLEHKLTRLIRFTEDQLKAQGKACEARIVQMIDNTY